LSKKIAILQSAYIPWKGYFDIINSVDEFVIYDIAGYSKNDWRNRNLIKTPDGLKWLTIPVKHAYTNQPIQEVQIFRTEWAAKHWKSISYNYSRALFFNDYSDILKSLYFSIQTNYLSEINLLFINTLCSLLGIFTEITKAESLNHITNPTDKLIEICKQKNATTYLSGPAAKNYLELDKFENANINVEWMDYSNYPEYKQLYPPFSHQVSILDLLYCTGPDAQKYLKSFA